MRLGRKESWGTAFVDFVVFPMGDEEDDSIWHALL